MKVAIGVQRLRNDGIRSQHSEDILDLRVLPGECLSTLWVEAEGMRLCSLPLYLYQPETHEEPHEKWVREYAESHDLSDFGPGIKEALTAAYQAGAETMSVELADLDEQLGRATGR